MKPVKSVSLSCPLGVPACLRPFLILICGARAGLVLSVRDSVPGMYGPIVLTLEEGVKPLGKHSKPSDQALLTGSSQGLLPLTLPLHNPGDVLYVFMQLQMVARLPLLSSRHAGGPFVDFICLCLR